MIRLEQPPATSQFLVDAERLLDDRQIDAARLAFDRAEAAGADSDRCAAGRWMCFMLAGDFESAWRESDRIRSRGGPDPHRFWNGQPIAGKRLIVRCLHGYGDAVQMLRYAPMLATLCSDVIYEVPPAMFEIAPHFRGVDRVITWGQHAPTDAPLWDSQVEITELPYIFRTQHAELPIATKYLVIGGPALAVRRDLRMPRVGLVWAAGEWNPTRSIPFSVFRSLLDLPSIEFWSLQGGLRNQDWEPITDHSRFRDAADYGSGIKLLASVISQMDLVITVDTLAAHLAGAMGVPAWVLLQHAADWRWMMNTCASPWYPTLRLFRDSLVGDWQDLVLRVRDELQIWREQWEENSTHDIHYAEQGLGRVRRLSI